MAVKNLNSKRGERNKDCHILTVDKLSCALSSNQYSEDITVKPCLLSSVCFPINLCIRVSAFYLGSHLECIIIKHNLTC